MHNVRGDHGVQVHAEIKLTLGDVKESNTFEVRLNSELSYIKIRSSLSLLEEK